MRFEAVLTLPSKTARGAPISTEIRARIKRAKQRFHANDNISSFVEPGDLDALLDEVALKMEGVLESLVIDTESDHNTRETARRVAKMYLTEVFRGRYVPAPPVTMALLDELVATASIVNRGS